MNFRTMPEPDRIAKLPKFNGIPIPATTQIDDNGIPNFKVADATLTAKFKAERKCSICGQPLDYWIAFMVSEEEARTRIIYDNPNHKDCLEYAFNVCPWLFYSKAKYSDISKVKLNVEGARLGSAHPERDKGNDRPSKLGVYVCRNYENVLIPVKGTRTVMRVCKASKPVSIEWIEGH